MRVPMKVDYGVRALVELAPHHGGIPIRTAEIAAHQNIPEPYLDHLLSILNKFGFIKSRRGPQGGHSLAKPPSEITLKMVVNSLESQAASLDCLDEPSECTLSSACAQREIWRSVEEAFQSVLNSTTISDLADRQQEMISRSAMANSMGSP